MSESGFSRLKDEQDDIASILFIPYNPDPDFTEFSVKRRFQTAESLRQV